MKKKLTFKENMFIGSMLFGLFFGAGNLIFPIHLGQAAGSNVFIANLGFLITAIGLPFLGIIAIGISKTSGLFEIASRVNKTYAYIFTIALYLVIGPFSPYLDWQLHHLKLHFRHFYHQSKSLYIYLFLASSSL